MTKDAISTEPTNGFFAGGSRRAADLAKSVSTLRPAKPATARSRIAATKTKKVRSAPLGPTPERIAKGDIDIRSGAHRSIPPIERLRDQGKLAPKLLINGQMTFDPRENQALFEAALKLRRHYDGLGLSIKAQDLNKIAGGTASDDLDREEVWVFDRDCFRGACRLMGWSETSPHRGAARIVVAIVCDEMTVGDAASVHLVPARTEAMQATAMDRLREGLFVLASHWKML